MKMRITRRRRPLVEALVAESAARKRAEERGDDPDLCPEALAAQAYVEMSWILHRRISEAPDGYIPGFADSLTD